MHADTAAAAHASANHTCSHAGLPARAPAARDDELDRLAAFVAAETGQSPTIVRPPYGASSPRLRAALTARGLTEIRWNIDPRDWAFTDPASLRAAIVAAIVEAGGGIVVLHDTEKVTALALPGVLDDLAAWNCTRVRRGKPPIIPVSLHYFLRDGDQPRPVPAEVEARTRRHREALVTRCGPAGGHAGGHAGGPDDAD
jgi:peptidoglycan/xylan/chitin deacetylase (PgdA/CDA1 family)